jgi:drug/metabolite transporter (DMT)-like permease
MNTREPPISFDAPSRPLVIAGFLIVYVIWGSTYLGIRLAIESIPPLFMAGTRYLVAGGAMFLFAFSRGAKLPSRAEWYAALVVGGCLLLGGNGGLTFAEQYIPSGSAALLVATVPIFLTTFAWIARLTSRPSAAVLFALFLGLAGVFILSRPESQSFSPAAQHNWYLGVTVLLVASAIWAAGSLYSKKAARPSSAVLGVGIQMICGGALLLIVSVSTGEAGRFEWSKVSMRSILAWWYLVIFGAIIAFTAYVWLVRVCAPSLVGTYAFVNPVIAVFLGSAFAGEELNFRTMCGAAVIVAAVALVVFFSNRPAKPPLERNEPGLLSSSACTPKILETRPRGIQ